MQIIETPLSKENLFNITKRFDDEMVKGVVDIGKKIIAIDAEMHADLEQFLLCIGSLQEDLWGVNFYPGKSDGDFLEFDSIINIRPRQNRHMYVDDENVREKIWEVVKTWIKNI